ncbi:putative F-box/FBD/LRR-repeat protein At4g03220 [Prunus persica]|uniref:putative F-box/FBD/LRR-repeat protein At4g03220 n=1 Tax=Prunus persica TaxID=3760 RepID=UPI0009AB9023|nr:putative F-box/FBD/LRR-repeat protein At4g03220 [Prunus persica]
MEHKPKLMATVSRQGQGVHADCIMIDRLSNLPDPIAHHIFSFVDLKDIVRVGCASKRCRQFHLSTPTLSFNFNEFPDMKKSPCSKRLEVMNSLDRLLAHRQNDKLKRFHIHWVPHNRYVEDCSCDESFRIMTWVYDAVRCEVEELDLDICVHQETPLALSSFMFLCDSLRSLSVNMKCVLKAPPLNSSSNLKSLNLREVCIVDEEFFTWISCCCKCIKELRLHDIYGVQNITIESSSLESFVFRCPGLSAGCNLNISGEKLESLHIYWGNIFLDRKSSLNLFAPNLKSLIWSGSLFSHQNVGKLTCLEKAELSLKVKSGKEFDIIYEILCSMPEVKVLILHKEITKALLKEGPIPTLFCARIHYLQMHMEGLFDFLVPAMVCFFRGMPSLNTLYLKSDQITFHPEARSSGFDAEFWKSQNLAFIKKLRLVNIELSNGSNGIELARYILEHAQNLEKMAIVHSPEQSNAIGKLNESKKAPNAIVVFEEDQERGTRKHGPRAFWLFSRMLQRSLDSIWSLNFDDYGYP